MGNCTILQQKYLLNLYLNLFCFVKMLVSVTPVYLQHNHLKMHLIVNLHLYFILSKTQQKVCEIFKFIK